CADAHVLVCHCCCASDALPLLSLFHASMCPVLYTLSLHDALPICGAALRTGQRCGRTSTRSQPGPPPTVGPSCLASSAPTTRAADRKSTRLNSSHVAISYAAFCLKKKTSIPFLHFYGAE